MELPSSLPGNGERVAAVVEHQHLPGVLFVPQDAPALFQVALVHHRPVVHDAHEAPGIGHAVFVLRVERFGAVCVADERRVGDIGGVKLLQHALGGHFADHIIAGDDDVVIAAAAFQLGVQALVGVVGGVVDADARQVFKFLHHIHGAVGAARDVFAPVVDIQRNARVLEAGVIVTGGNLHTVRCGKGRGGQAGPQARPQEAGTKSVFLPSGYASSPALLCARGPAQAALFCGIHGVGRKDDG